jgi:sugar phosphate isomerase/epimerase
VPKNAFRYACALQQYDMIGYQFDDAVKNVAKLGYEGIELHVPPPPHQKDWAPLKRLLKRLGLEAATVVVQPADWAKSDEKRRERTVTAFKDAVALATFLGTTRVMTETGPASQDLSRDKAVKLAAENISKCADFAHDHGVDTVLLECVPPPMNYVVDTMERFLEFRKLVGAKNVYANVDASNYLMAGDDPSEVLRALGPVVKGIHVKDGMKEGGHWTPIGEGQVNWTQFFGAAKEIGYSGWVTAEYEGAATGKYYSDPEKASKDTLAFMKKVIRKL